MQPEILDPVKQENHDARGIITRLLFILIILLVIVNPFLPSDQIRLTAGDLTGWLVLVMLVIMPLSPILSIIKTAGFLLTGRLHFPVNRIGEKVTDENGREYTVFRQVVVDAGRDQPARPGALLTLRFEVTNLTPGMNRFYSLLPLMLYLGDRGFRSKTFTINGRYCMSIYEWDTLEDAQNYLQSLALETILLRSVTGTFTSSIRPL